jgi:predicted ABC-type ATPase
MPDLLIIGGPNGSGKSTIYPAIRNVTREEWSYEPEYIKEENYVNADNIAKDLHLSDSEAARKAIQKIEYFIELGESFSIESTLSGKTLIAHINRAKQKGFRVYVIYVLVDSAELSMVRVTQRALLGKHYINLTNILTRYSRSILNFFNSYKHTADFWLVADNSGLIIRPLCWGGGIFGNNVSFAESKDSVYYLNDILMRNSLNATLNEDFVNTEDQFTPIVIRKIQTVIEREIRNRPVGNFVCISEKGIVRFVRVHN